MIRRDPCNACGGTTFTVSNGVRSQCWKCNGRGYVDHAQVPCARCNGIGKVVVDGGVPIQCTICDGSGKVAETVV